MFHSMVCMKKSNYSVGSIPRGISARNCEAAEQLQWNKQTRRIIHEKEKQDLFCSDTAADNSVVF